MNVISRKKLATFWASKPEYAKHATAFEHWFRIARRAEWSNFQDAKATFGQTDVASDTASGKTATIFDIGGNKYRIVTLIDYLRQTVLITHVMTHIEYDKERWKGSFDHGHEHRPDEWRGFLYDARISLSAAHSE